MKHKIILAALMASVIAGCSSVYKASQTPDDVYYSPGRASVAKADLKQDKYEDYVGSQDDQYLRMKVANRQRWSSLDDYSYWNDSRYVPSYSYDYYLNNWNSPYAWNNLYSPFSSSVYFGGFNSFGYYSPYSFYNPYTYGYYPYGSYTKAYVSPVYANPLHSNVNRPSFNSYSNRNYNNYNTPGSNRQGFGSTLRRVFSPTEGSTYNNRNTDNSTYRATERTYTPSPSSGSSSSRSSSSGSSGGVSRPTRSH